MAEQVRFDGGEVETPGPEGFQHGVAGRAGVFEDDHQDANLGERAGAAEDVCRPFVVRHVVEDVADETEVDGWGRPGVGNRAGNHPSLGTVARQDLPEGWIGLDGVNGPEAVQQPACQITRTAAPIDSDGIRTIPRCQFVEQRDGARPFVIAAQQGLEVAGIVGAVGRVKDQPGPGPVPLTEVAHLFSLSGGTGDGVGGFSSRCSPAFSGTAGLFPMGVKGHNRNRSNSVRARPSQGITQG